MRVNKKKMITYCGAFLALFFFIGWMMISEYCRTNAPTQPDITNGTVYPKNYHGSIVYLNGTENALMYGLPGAGFLILITFGVLQRYLK